LIGCEDRLRNDLYCVEWGVEVYSNSNSCGRQGRRGEGEGKEEGKEREGEVGWGRDGKGGKGIGKGRGKGREGKGMGSYGREGETDREGRIGGGDCLLFI